MKLLVPTLLATVAASVVAAPAQAAAPTTDGLPAGFGVTIKGSVAVVDTGFAMTCGDVVLSAVSGDLRLTFHEVVDGSGVYHWSGRAVADAVSLGAATDSPTGWSARAASAAARRPARASRPPRRRS